MSFRNWVSHEVIAEPNMTYFHSTTTIVVSWIQAVSVDFYWKKTKCTSKWTHFCVFNCIPRCKHVIPQTSRCWLKFQTLSLSVVPLTSWQHSYYHRVLIVLCDGNDCASLELCRFSHSHWACLFLGFVLKVICRLGKKRNKKGLVRSSQSIDYGCVDW